MKSDEYLKNRLEDQINWYDEKSRWYQKWFKRLRVIEILAASCIPFLTGFITEQTASLKIAAGTLGVLIAVISGVVALFKFQEHWIQYRTTSESLKHHKYLYLTGTNPYDNEESFNLLVDTVEGLISKENSNWTRFAKERNKEKENG